MYVIFPADEIILLSYGVAQNPRLQRRPTLDNLQEPICVPSIGIRPPTNSNLDVISNHSNSLSRENSNLRSSLTSHKRDPSPNVSFADDFMNKSRTSVVEENNFRADDSLGSTNNTLDSKKKNNFKSKISKISLGKLGRPSSNESTEPVSSRLREDLEIRVSNPTFTHDNLREKNFDAFFASGASVYSLEKKEKQLSDASLLSQKFLDASLLTPLTPISTTSTFDTSSSFAPSPTTPTSISSERPRKSSIATLFSPRFTSKQSSPSSSSSKRPQSAELYRSVQGDRCPILMNFGVSIFFVLVLSFFFAVLHNSFLLVWIYQQGKTVLISVDLLLVFELTNKLNGRVHINRTFLIWIWVPNRFGIYSCFC